MTKFLREERDMLEFSSLSEKAVSQMTCGVGNHKYEFLEQCDNR